MYDFCYKSSLTAETLSLAKKCFWTLNNLTIENNEKLTYFITKPTFKELLLKICNHVKGIGLKTVLSGMINKILDLGSTGTYDFEEILMFLWSVSPEILLNGIKQHFYDLPLS